MNPIKRLGITINKHTAIDCQSPTPEECRYCLIDDCQRTCSLPPSCTCICQEPREGWSAVVKVIIIMLVVYGVIAGIALIGWLLSRMSVVGG
jgi:hypothetical protein